MKKIKNIRNKILRKLPVLIFDIASIPIALITAFWLRFNLESLPTTIINKHTATLLALLIFVQVNCYYYFKVYRGLWRFCSLNDVARILKAVVSAIFFVISLLYLTSELQFIPRSVLPLYGLNLVTLLCAGRLLNRYYWDRSKSRSKLNVKKVLIIGAGEAGAWLIRDIKKNPFYEPVGFVDDNLIKRGLDVHGVRVIGAIRDLPNLVQQLGVKLIFIAIPSVGSKSMRRIVNYCEKSQIPFRTLPDLNALASGQVDVKALRKVKIEDLLGRDQVAINWEEIKANIYRKNIVVTGGGGSIGSELCRQVASLNPQKLLILDNSEFNLYKIERELKEKFPEIIIELSLTNVCDKDAIKYNFARFAPHVVFHAASYKHVPMLETQVRNAVQNNILGTQVVALESVNVNVEKFILISTDKAVNPTNIMGMTKRVAEIYCQNLNTKVVTDFITVRFGNVLGSVGSVVPLFQSQLQKGGPLTVTHPEIERFFMTIKEACQLILQAMVNGKEGEIFVLDMGDPIKIKDLALQMIRLSGKEPYKDINIEYTGLRPGEKLFEELFHKSEQLVNTQHEKLFKAKFRLMDWKDLTQTMRMLELACKNYETNELIIILKSLVPEFCLEKASFV